MITFKKKRQALSTHPHVVFISIAISWGDIRMRLTRRVNMGSAQQAIKPACEW